MDYTWSNKFSVEALQFISQHKGWLHEKINLAINHPDHNKIGMDWIYVVDYGNAKITNDSIIVKTALASSHDLESYINYCNMFFNGDDIIRNAIQNLQSNVAAIKQIAIAIVRGDKAVYDNTIQFPFSVGCWKKPQ